MNLIITLDINTIMAAIFIILAVILTTYLITSENTNEQ